MYLFCTLFFRTVQTTTEIAMKITAETIRISHVCRVDEDKNVHAKYTHAKQKTNEWKKILFVK